MSVCVPRGTRSTAGFTVHSSLLLLALLVPEACWAFQAPVGSCFTRAGGNLAARSSCWLGGAFGRRGAYLLEPTGAARKREAGCGAACRKRPWAFAWQATAASGDGDGADVASVDEPEDAQDDQGPHLGPVPDIERSESLELAGTPDALMELRERYLANRNVTATELASCFPYPLDDFQMGAVRALIGKRSVVVSAPTGSGKTVCGEAAVYLGVAMGKRVLYATPLKALSNQKYNDFCAQFGAERVGLLTGDVSINRANANIIVLTTEIYRNMLYDVQDGSVRDVHSVILDEFHYMNDRDRGTVWEESVIYSPPHVLIVALSATMRNVKDIRDWFASVHGPTDLITSDYRPVPLRFKYLDRKGICELFDKEPNKKGLPRLNRLLLPDAMSGAGGREARSYESGRWRRGGDGGRLDKRDRRDGNGGGERWGGSRTSSRWDEARSPQKGKLRIETDYQSGGDKRSGRGRGGSTGGRGGIAQVPSFGFSVRQMQKRDLLPAIVFVFSRKGCDAAAEEVGSQRVSLVSPDEKARIMDKLKTFSAKHKEVATEERIRLALRGIASHHAGMVPLWKSLVEELYQQGLIKVVFATETLAAGINMPARTTVITSMSKRSSDGVGPLTSNELRQMCGRAGRRGKDTVGHSIMMRSRWEGAPEAFTLVMQQPDPLTSKFAPNYAMVLNLLMDRPLDECRQIVERSFGSFLAAKNKHKLQVAADANSDLRQQVQEAQDIVERVDPEDLRVFQKLTERLKTEQRVARILSHQAQDNRKSMFEDMILYCQAGTPVLIRYTSVDPYSEDDQSGVDIRKGPPDSGIILGAYDASQVLDVTTPDYVVCLTKSNRIRIITAADVVDVDTESETVSLGPDVTAESLIESLPPKRKWLRAGVDSFVLAGNPLTGEIVDRIPVLEKPGTPPEVLAQEDRVRHVEALLVAHPIFARDDRKDLLRAARYLADKAATGELRALNSANKKSGPSQGEDDVPVAWADFLACKQCLQDFDYVRENEVTDVGRLIGSINADNPLWVGSVLLYSEELYDFGPHELAAALACLVADSSRPDIYVAVEPSDKVSLFTVNALDMQTRVVAAQLSHGISFDVPLDSSMAGLVEAWALGTPWSSILGLTSLQEGDIIRLLRRVLDLLRQIPRLPYVPGARGVDAQLRLNARRALTIMDRFPVSDDVTYSIDDDEGLADDDTMALAGEMAAKREALVGKADQQRRMAADLLSGPQTGWADEVTSTSELLGLESQDDEDQVWIGPLGEELDVANGASWGSSSDVGDWGSEDEEEDEADELVGDDEAFIRSLGLGGNKEGLIGDFTL